MIPPFTNVNILSKLPLTTDTLLQILCLNTDIFKADSMRRETIMVWALLRPLSRRLRFHEELCEVPPGNLRDG